MKKNFVAALTLLAILSSTLACSLVTGGLGEVSLENLRMAYDEDGRNLTTVFAPSDIFFVVGDLNNAPAGTVVDAKWIVEQIEGYDTGEIIYEQTINDFTEESFTGTIYFQLSNDSGWLAGAYKVDIYLDGSFVESVPFSVR